MSNDEKIKRLETIVVFLAKGILAHEYSKDLCRDSVELVLLEVADYNLKQAMDYAERTL